MNKTSQWNSIFTFIMAMIGWLLELEISGDLATCCTPWWRILFHTICNCNSNHGGSVSDSGIRIRIQFQEKLLQSDAQHPPWVWNYRLDACSACIHCSNLLPGHIGMGLRIPAQQFQLRMGKWLHILFLTVCGWKFKFISITTIIFPALICTLILWAVFWEVSINDVDKGIGKLSTVLIPLLFVIMIFIFAYSFTLPGFQIGINTLFTPDWSALLNINVWLAAFGQIIFSLSIGQAMVYTYASYLPKNTKLIDEVLLVVVTNSL